MRLRIISRKGVVSIGGWAMSNKKWKGGEQKMYKLEDARNADYGIKV